MKKISSMAFAVALLLCACGQNGKKDAAIPEVSGHRGANAIAPENTLASADSCIKYGIQWMECDVCISKDSVFYILHDSTLDRTTNGEGPISDWISTDIDTLDAGSWFGGEFAGQRVPRFADLLRKAHDNGLNITVDFRSGDLHELLDLVKSEDMLGRCCFTFSDEELAAEFRAIAPEVKTLQAYIRTPEDYDRVVKTLSPDIAVFWIDNLTEDLVRKCHDDGMKVLALVLGLDDKTALNQKAVDLGVDVVATDRPEEFVKKYRSVSE